jgi:hypothetical protein
MGIHPLNAETLERFVQRGLQVLGRVVEAAVPLCVLADAALGGDLEEIAGFRAAIGQELADALFREAAAVHVRCIQVVDAEFHGARQDGLRLVGVDGAVEAGERHGADADGGNGDAGLTEFSLLHGISLGLKARTRGMDLTCRCSERAAGAQRSRFQS